MISIFMSLTLLKLCKICALATLDMDMVPNFVMKVIFMRKMVMALTLILAMEFLRLCKEHLTIVILMTTLVLVMVLEFNAMGVFKFIFSKSFRKTYNYDVTNRTGYGCRFSSGIHKI